MIASILTALLSHCESLSVGSPPLPVSFPEVGFVPPADGRYLEVRVMPNVRAWEGVASGALEQGLLHIDLHWPKGEGVIRPAELLGLAADHFPKSQKLHSEGVTVTLTHEPSPGQPLSEADALIFPLSIRWVATAA